MMKHNNYFEYSVPYLNELQQEYITPYRFSQELRNSVHYMFAHPVHNRHFKLFVEHERKWDTNDMLKHPYLVMRHYLEHPQQFGNSVDNIIPHMIVAMWKAFMSIHRKKRGLKTSRYLPTSMGMIKLANGRFIEQFLSDIDTQNIIYSSEDMVKRREGLDLYERKKVRTTNKHFEYLCSLE